MRRREHAVRCLLAEVPCLEVLVVVLHRLPRGLQRFDDHAHRVGFADALRRRSLDVALRERRERAERRRDDAAVAAMEGVEVRPQEIVGGRIAPGRPRLRGRAQCGQHR